MSVRLTYDNNQSQSGAFIHFTQLQAEDLFLYGVLIDAKNCKENTNVVKIFQQQYQTISLFSMEEVYKSIGTNSVGTNQTTDIEISGDLLYQLAIVCTWNKLSIDQSVNGVAADKTIKNWAYTTNFAAAFTSNVKFLIDNQAFDQNNTDSIVLLNGLMNRVDQRYYIDKLSGNTQENTQMAPEHSQIKTLSMLKLFFSDSNEKAFPHLRAGQPNIKVQTNFLQPSKLVCYTQNLEGYDWDTKLQPQNVGYISTQIFLGEHERLIHVNTESNMLIEQNMFTSFTGNVGTPQNTNIIHPVKYMLWALKKQKYMNKSRFLNFDSFVDSDRNKDNFLLGSTVRFVQRNASYIASVDYELVAGFNAANTPLNTATAALNVATVNLADWTSASTNAVLRYNVDNNYIIQSQFSANSNAVGLVQSGKLLAQEVNNQLVSVESIFQRLQPSPIQTGNQNQFQKDSSILILGNSLLTLEEASIPISVWESHINGGSYAHVALPQSPDHVANMLFSMYSKGYIVFSHGPNDNDFNATGNVIVDSKTMFSVITRNNKFNYGHPDFDVVVQQYDNYGRYLNKTGEFIQTSELLLGSQPRFKKSSFYTSQLHQKMFFPGRTPEGVQLHSFALSPNSIKPSGSLNFTKSQSTLNVITETPDDNQTDQLIILAVVDNIIDFKENTYQVLYTTSMNN